MDEPRFLPHLAAACRAMLGDDDLKNIPVGLRSTVASRAKVGQTTVDRFLAGERVPRSRDLDQMVTAVAAVAETQWYIPWKEATERAEAANVEWERFIKGDLPIAPEPPTDSGEPGGEKLQHQRR